jgi:chromate transport protein ChrA
LKDVGNTFGVFFALLFAAISMKKSPLLMAFISGIVLYYWSFMLHTVLKLQIKSLLDLFMMVILLLGSVVSFLALMIISPTIAWIHLCLWILMFCFMGYKNRKELDQIQMIPKRIKNFIKDHGDNDNGISTSNSEIAGNGLLPI